MLIGLLGKNAILIIEVANQCRKEGVSIMGAAIQGATSRLRPILMTSFAFISGLIPLAVASGAGALGNRSIGTAAAGRIRTDDPLKLLPPAGSYQVRIGGRPARLTVDASQNLIIRDGCPGGRAVLTF